MVSFVSGHLISLVLVGMLHKYLVKASENQGFVLKKYGMPYYFFFKLNKKNCLAVVCSVLFESVLL